MICWRGGHSCGQRADILVVGVSQTIAVRFMRMEESPGSEGQSAR